MQQGVNLYQPQDELDEEININLKSIIMAYKSRVKTMNIIFSVVLVIFILMTFILPKKWTVSSDLYINVSNNSNMTEINPFAIEELSSGTASFLSGSSSGLINETELLQSPIITEKVIRENNLRYKKLYGIIPTKKTGEYISPEKLLKKLSIENKKGTNIISVSYTGKDKELSYNVVVSVINNYIELYKMIHSDKAKADKKIIEAEYNKAKAELDVKVDDYTGLPQNAIAGTGSLAAMSVFSETARKAMSSMTGEVVENERSKMAIAEESEKVTELGKKLQWAKLVEEMSGTSKVLVIKEPEMPKAWEQVSPKLFTQIILGIIFGIITSLIYFIHVENHSKKLTYSMLGNDVIYNIKDEFMKLKLQILSNNNKNGKTLLIALNDVYSEDVEKLQTLKNIRLVKADISDEFVSLLNEYNGIILMERIDETDAEEYKSLKVLLNNMNKKILTEVLI